MSRKAASNSKLDRRGGKRNGAGRKPKYGVPMVSRSITMREDAWEIVEDCAAARSMSQGEWIQRRILPPSMVAKMEALEAANAK